MTEYAFPTCAETRDLCDRVVIEMQRLFGVSAAEALGRINRQWAGDDLSSPDDIVLHEEEEFWAKTIYYTKDSMWWLDESAAKPVPYP